MVENTVRLGAQIAKATLVLVGVTLRGIHWITTTITLIEKGFCDIYYQHSFCFCIIHFTNNVCQFYIYHGGHGVSIATER